MFGVALSINRSHFHEIIRNPKSFLAGFLSQFLILPGLTFLLILALNPLPGLALGMMLVACCPGGNVSNFYSLLAKGNIALSVSLTAMATLGASLLTPLNFELWGSNLPQAGTLFNEISIDLWAMVKTVTLILALPLVLGLWFQRHFKELTRKIERPIRFLSFVFLAGFIGFALANNWSIFMTYYDYVVYLVLIHNAVALGAGYLWARLFTRSSSDIRSITIETGIQNSALGLVIIFTFFGGQGGMAVITAWWGVWHLISGLVVSFLFQRRSVFSTGTT